MPCKFNEMKNQTNKKSIKSAENEKSLTESRISYTMKLTKIHRS